MDCPFCAIADGTLEANVVYEDEDFVVFHDLHPKAKTHLLLIPKKHIVSLAQAKEEDTEIVAELFLLAKDIATTLGLKGYQLQMNVEKDGGQEVMHMHLHLLSSTTIIEE